ncbi:MAG: chorismate synthase [Chitinophagales bacterium]
MAGNSFGVLFRITTFGESHGEGIGVVIDGCPAGLTIDIPSIQAELERRRPGQSAITSARKETDEVTILSGLFEGATTGAPLTLFIKNHDHRPDDYAQNRTVFRPSHADFTYAEKYGRRDHRGGGRSSARETAARVAAGAVAKQLLKHAGIQVQAYVSAIGSVRLERAYRQLDLTKAEKNLVRMPDETLAAAAIELIQEARSSGDTLGGVISAVITGVPVGLGEPVFDKLHADLGKAMLSINAVHGFEYGSGFAGAAMRGSDHNDSPQPMGKGIYRSANNYSGGIQGGISNGEDIYFSVAFKPVATLMQAQETIDENGNKAVLEMKGRHDPCVVPRAVPIVEAMAALVLADHLLRHKSSRL